MNAVTRLFTDKQHQPTVQPAADAAAEFRRLLEASLPKALRDAENAVAALRDRREELVNKLQAISRDLNARMPNRPAPSLDEREISQQVDKIDLDLRPARSHLRDVRERVARDHHDVVAAHLRVVAPTLLAATREMERVAGLLRAADSFALAHAVQPLGYGAHLAVALPVIHALSELIAPGSTQQSAGEGA